VEREELEGLVVVGQTIRLQTEEGESVTGEVRRLGEKKLYVKPSGGGRSRSFEYSEIESIEPTPGVCSHIAFKAVES
jgi:hypothetical protein